MENTTITSNQYNSTTGQNTNAETENSPSNAFNMENLTGLLGGLNIPDALKKYGGSATKAISGLSTTQKVVGGALLLLGATYLSRRSGGGWLKNMAGSGKAGKNK